ncbi:prolyl endopeptidase FAP-like [Drosophila gunungcola]|uniref:prolyl endopeptidase FAP-like n=1 Tax=Drosophila gunungcola TaxID=103775 RepID=UPI0022E1F820|nr:prolyl endopeptidase FAP-like [Drosophila gunungcola]
MEEILKSPEAIWSSSDGTHFMFALFNDTNVGMMTYPWLSSGALFTGSGIFPGNFFPETKNVRYPTPGTANPEVQLWAVDITNLSAIQKFQIKPPASLDGQDYYLTSAGWISDNNRQISVAYMGRSQNYSVISMCSKLRNWNCFEIHSERAPENEWLDIFPHPVFSSDGSSFLLLASIQESGQYQFTHIKHITTSERRASVISHGRYETFLQTFCLCNCLRTSFLDPQTNRILSGNELKSLEAVKIGSFRA